MAPLSTSVANKVFLIAVTVLGLLQGCEAIGMYKLLANKKWLCVNITRSTHVYFFRLGVPVYPCMSVVLVLEYMSCLGVRARRPILHRRPNTVTFKLFVVVAYSYLYSWTRTCTPRNVNVHATCARPYEKVLGRTLVLNCMGYDGIAIFGRRNNHT